MMAILPRSRHVRCRFCGAVLPGWLPILNRPEAAILLHHLSALHPVEIKPYLVRMETQCIDAVVMELFERVEASDQWS